MIQINRELCTYCGGCVCVCPTGALELIETYVEVDNEKCNNCGICSGFCPMGAIKLDRTEAK
ncbi:MAG: 4Fe-4S binding protein [Euryarchaeota archaeon]|nr:4Fe-4S binding protein [Euryarchaeota archaeon]